MDGVRTFATMDGWMDPFAALAGWTNNKTQQPTMMTRYNFPKEKHTILLFLNEVVQAMEEEQTRLFADAVTLCRCRRSTGTHYCHLRSHLFHCL